MKREDFVNITEEHKKICEEVLGNIRNNCKDIDCDDCMFDNNNSSNKKFCTANQYSNPNDDKLDILFVESCKLFLKTFFNDIEKEEVLKIESQEVFDSVAFRIVYQNEEVLKRGEFKDNELDVYSSTTLEYRKGTLYIRGNVEECDDKIVVVSKEEFKDVFEKVRLINKKYDVQKKWRAEKNGVYFYIDVDFLVIKTQECYYDGDVRLYKAGNYFKTKEEAEKVAEQFKKVIENVKGEIMRTNYKFYILEGVCCEWDSLTDKTDYPIEYDYHLVEWGFIYFCLKDGEVIEKCELL